jgi:MFS family permease
MAARGRRYPLVIYTVMLSRWWTIVTALGFAMLGLAWLGFSRGAESWRWLATGSVGVFCVVLGVIIFLLRKSAYVQPFGDHLRLATPFLRLNISYKRFHSTKSANMGMLFPKNSISKHMAEIIEPLAKMTAIIIELNALPMSQSSLRFFLSPLFFKDKTPHLVLLVDDWMRFSADIESMRTGTASSTPQKKRDGSILSRLPQK